MKAGDARFHYLTVFEILVLETVHLSSELKPASDLLKCLKELHGLVPSVVFALDS